MKLSLQKKRNPSPAVPKPGVADVLSRIGETLRDLPQDISALTPEELGQTLSVLTPLSDFLSECQDFALQEILCGGTVPGWKAIEGRSNRKWIDTDAAIEVLRKNGIPESCLYETKPRSLGQLENRIGKEKLHCLVGNLIEKPLGKPVLVPESAAGKPYPIAAGNGPSSAW